MLTDFEIFLPLKTGIY